MHFALLDGSVARFSCFDVSLYIFYVFYVFYGVSGAELGTPGRSPGERPAEGAAGRRPGNFFGTHFPSQLAENTAPVDKKRGPGTHQRQSASASGARQSGVRTASRKHPSTRAGDQDDVS